MLQSVKNNRTFFLTFGIACGLLSGSCNFATHSFNNGKLLEPGETLSTVSLGNRYGYTMNDDYTELIWEQDPYNPYLWNLTDSIFHPADTSYGAFFSFAYDWRLGVLSKYPFGQGFEAGFLMETPAQARWNVQYIPMLQFDGRFGLPSIAISRWTLNHDIDVGWIMGQWIDNSWFAEYACGFEFPSVTPYFNARVTRVCTEASSGSASVFDNADFLTQKKNTWNFRFCTGISFRLRRLPLLPDFIVPEAAFFFPMRQLRTPGVSWHIGMRWLDDK